MVREQRVVARPAGVKAADGVSLSAWEYALPGPAGAAGRAAEGRQAVAGEAPSRAAEEARGAHRPGVLLLHGPLGRASTWAETAQWLAPRFRVAALDTRGRGPSDPAPGPGDPSAAVTPEVAEGDAEAAVEQLGLAPALLIGHSFGAAAAWRLAARRPDLVAGVVAAEMRCSPLTDRQVEGWTHWLRSWPVPFPSPAEARTWFAERDPVLEYGPSPGRAAYFTEQLEPGPDGYRPRFSPARIAAEIEAWAHQPRWEELARVRCPVLVVRGLRGLLGRAEAQEMVRLLACGSYAEVPGAGHLLHAEQPEGWRRAVEPFVREMAVGPTGR